MIGGSLQQLPAEDHRDAAFLMRGERELTDSFPAGHNPPADRDAADIAVPERARELAASLIEHARDVFLTGIGASWNAALCAGSLFYQHGRPVFMQEAGDLVHLTTLPRGSIIIAISRSGRSIEILQYLAKADASGASVIGITNSADSPLARESRLAIVIPAMLDHAISANTYSSLLIAAGALAASVTTEFASVADPLFNAVGNAGECLELWQEQLENSTWLSADAAYYFLGRGSSLGTCQ
jgi:fructoselysine-6-P-deglycase FrlB-like protein